MNEAFIFAIGSIVFVVTTTATLLYAYAQFNAQYRIEDVPGVNEDADLTRLDTSPVGMAAGTDAGPADRDDDTGSQRARFDVTAARFLPGLGSTEPTGDVDQSAV